VPRGIRLILSKASKAEAAVLRTLGFTTDTHRIDGDLTLMPQSVLLPGSNRVLTSDKEFGSIGRALGLLATVVFALGVAVKVSWLNRAVDMDGNQAAFDAFYYHVPQINEFITHGFRATYTNFVAMTPGLHLLYAYLARSFGITSFTYDSGLLFAIHSLWMIAYLALNVFIIRKIYERNKAGSIMVLPLLASAYPIYSWVWPTTDLPATVLYLTAIAIEFGNRREASRLALYAVLGAAGVLLRQHYGFLAAVPAGILVANAIVQRSRLDLTRLLVYLLPVIPALAILGYFVSIWHGLVPPDQAYHFAPFSEPVSLAHVLGFTGLLGFPFAISLWRLLTRPAAPTLQSPGGRILPADNRMAIRILIAAVICGLVAVVTLPLNPSVESGRYGSMLWTIEEKLPSQLMRDMYLWAVISLGAAIWLAVATLCWRRREVIPTVVLFAMYAGTLLVQEFCFQRYVEEPMLLTLAVFIVWQTRLPKVETAVWGVCFGGYMLIGWIKLFQGFGGLGH
jgi:hypothetical protein